MSGIIGLSEVDEKIIIIREQKVIIDGDVAMLYGVETKRVNEAVANNSNKFPTIETSVGRGRHTKYKPQAFTEKGLYMLATILKSDRATQATIAIVEVFAKMRELSRTINQLSDEVNLAIMKVKHTVKRDERHREA